MAKIARVELLMVDLKPKVKRVDAIQSFVSQETPIVRITDADGAVGTGYSYTIGTGGHSLRLTVSSPARGASGECLRISDDSFGIETSYRTLPSFMSGQPNKTSGAPSG